MTKSGDDKLCGDLKDYVATITTNDDVQSLNTFTRPLPTTLEFRVAYRAQTIPALMHFQGWGQEARWSTRHALSLTIDCSGSVNADFFVEPQNRSSRNESVEN